MVCDLEAGVGTVVRAGAADAVVAVCEPTAKSIEVARRAIAAAGDARAFVVANRLREAGDAEAIRAALGAAEVIAVPDDPAIEAADREGDSPLDLAPDGPGVRAVAELAARLAA